MDVLICQSRLLGGQVELLEVRNPLAPSKPV